MERLITHAALAELPPVLSAKDIQRYFRMSRVMAYSLLNRPECGAFAIGGRKFLQTACFYRWMETQSGEGTKADE